MMPPPPLLTKTYGILLLLCVLTCACGVTEDAIKEGSQIKQIIRDFSISETKGGKPDWILDSSNAEIIEENNTILLTSPVIKFFKDGKYNSTLKASRGRIDTESYDIWGEGHCFLSTIKGEELVTKNLHYKSDEKKIVTNEKVKLIKKNETIYGDGLEATPDLETVIIKNQIVEMEGEI